MSNHNNTPKHPANKAKTAKGELSRRNIIVATRKILAAQDLSSLTLDDVATHSGVAKSSVLWHFGSKNGLLLAVVEDIFYGIEHRLSELSSAYDSNKNPDQLVLKLAVTLAHEMQKTPEANALLIAFIVNKTSDQSIIKQVRIIYRSHRKTISDIITTNMTGNAKPLAATILAIIDGIYLQWYLDPQEIDLEEALLSSIGHLEF